MKKILDSSKIEKSALEKIESFNADLIADIEMEIAKNEWVIVGMKQNPVVSSARKFLSEKNVPFKYIEHGSYFSKWKQRLAIKLWTGWPTFPQIFHKGILVGGFDDLKKYSKTT